jgi:hypothetical protein
LFLAVNEPIEELRNKGLFREDLFYRMRSIIRFPSLDEILRSTDSELRGGLIWEASTGSIDLAGHSTSALEHRQPVWMRRLRGHRVVRCLQAILDPASARRSKLGKRQYEEYDGDNQHNRDP